MKKIILRSGIGFLFVLTSFIFSISFLNAEFIEMDQGPQNQTIQRGVTQKASIPQTILPDLLVERIWMDNNCHIYFTLKNRSLGSLDDNAYRNSRVQYSTSSETKEYSLAQIDPSRFLSRPQGRVDYCVNCLESPPSSFPSSLTITVRVDYNQVIRESDETNNVRTEVFTAPSQLPQRLTTIPSDRKWDIGETVRFEWDCSCFLPTANSFIHILLCTPGGTIRRDITASPYGQPVRCSQKSYSWRIPDDFSPGGYNLRMVTTNSAEALPICPPNFLDCGEAYIYGQVNLLSPQQGETWRRGERKEFRWEYKGEGHADLEISLLKQDGSKIITVGNTTLKNRVFEWVVPDLSGHYGSCKVSLKTRAPGYRSSETNIQILDQEVDLEVNLEKFLIKRNPDRYKVIMRCRNKGTRTLDYVPIEWVITTGTGTFVEQNSAGFGRMYPYVEYTHYIEVPADRKVQVWIDRQNIHRELESLRSDNYKAIY
ncbi:MAG: hypothetical protein NC818_07660 [Candidatus Omnitrophica bacterium]|nr:hypothetical protein [Candidatus Omnitrophota bacterium]